MLYRFDSVSKSYGPDDVLRAVTWQHNPGERVGLVGRNGAGKTTLFRILRGEEEPDQGDVIRSSGLAIGALDQHLQAQPGTSLFDFVLSAYEEILSIERKMRELEHDLESAGAEKQEALLDRYARLQHDYEHADGYTLHSNVERVLTGVGIEEEIWSRDVHEMSGGQQNRAMLARLLLADVDVMLLDEPTNHLDLRGIEFLEQFLASYDGGYVLISHDRTFLNRTVDEIIELNSGQLIEYHGNYDRFLELRQERISQLETEYERQQAHVERTEEFIRRNIAGQKTKQAKSRRKMLEKIDRLERPERDETLASFDLDGGARSSAIAFTIDGLTVGRSGNRIAGPLDLLIRRGERYAILGPNGSGKSTLLQTLAGRLEPFEGKVTTGTGVSIGYYDQTLGDLRPGKKVIDEIWDLDHSQTEEDCRNYLARFSFSGDDVFKKVSSLSGGEKGRLALAKIMFEGGNSLLLDEPTNHLDVYTREALEEALESFTGVLIVVSHDRYFVDKIAEMVLLVEDGEIELHHGNYSEVVERLVRESAADSRPEVPKTTGNARVERSETKIRGKELRRLGAELERVENRIAELESARETNDKRLCDPEIYSDGDLVKEIQAENGAWDEELEELYQRWDELTVAREEA